VRNSGSGRKGKRKRLKTRRRSCSLHSQHSMSSSKYTHHKANFLTRLHCQSLRSTNTLCVKDFGEAHRTKKKRMDLSMGSRHSEHISQNSISSFVVLLTHLGEIRDDHFLSGGLHSMELAQCCCDDIDENG